MRVTLLFRQADWIEVHQGNWNDAWHIYFFFFNKYSRAKKRGEIFDFEICIWKGGNRAPFSPFNWILYLKSLYFSCREIIKNNNVGVCSSKLYLWEEYNIFFQDLFLSSDVYDSLMTSMQSIHSTFALYQNILLLLIHVLLLLLLLFER